MLGLKLFQVTKKGPRWLKGPKCTWWRHPMETFSASLALCAGNSPGTGEIPSQGPVTRSFDLRLNKRLSTQSRRRWFETPSRPLWRQCNDKAYIPSDLIEWMAWRTGLGRCYRRERLLLHPVKRINIRQFHIWYEWWQFLGHLMSQIPTSS